MFGEDSIKFLIEVLDLELELAIEPLHFAPVSEFAVTISSSCVTRGGEGVGCALVGVHALGGVHGADGAEGVETQTGAPVDRVLRTELLVVGLRVATRLG